MDADQPQLLQVVASEMEAALIVARLDGEGIEAWSEGGLTAGFRAEAPGGARVLVHAADYARAVEVLGQEP